MTDLLPIPHLSHPVFDANNGLKNKPLVIAGPCSAETEEQTLATALELADKGVSIYRAGVWKPRTMPGSFEGIGEKALSWLRRVKDETGMLTATEVATPGHVKAAVESGIDILWIGARTSANPFAVQDIADTLSEIGAQDICVLVKNPVCADLELWIGAFARLYAAGIRHLGAIHRGFSTIGQSIYRNPPHWEIPIELRLRYPSLPIIFDPSHIGGCREMIQPLSQQALDTGFDGLIIETHCNPDCALSDARQQITPAELDKILRNLKVRSEDDGTPLLDTLRSEIDRIDAELLALLSERMKIARDIGHYKKEKGMPILQPGRYNDVMSARAKTASESGISENALRQIWLAIHDESVRQQREL